MSWYSGDLFILFIFYVGKSVAKWLLCVVPVEMQLYCKFMDIYNLILTQINELVLFAMKLGILSHKNYAWALALVLPPLIVCMPPHEKVSRSTPVAF